MSSEIHLQIKAQMETYLEESEKFEDKGVKAAATRARKALGELGKLCLLYTSPSPRDS